MFDRHILETYFVCGSQDCYGRDPLVVIEQALHAGVTCFQLREKGPNALRGEALRHFAQAVQHRCRHYGVPLLINDDIALAHYLDAEGVHLGQQDCSVLDAQKQLPHKIIGLSVHDCATYDTSPIHAVHYIGVGPIHPTRSKKDAQSAIGYAGIASLRQHDASVPIVAIGGIQLHDIVPLRQAGADGVAIISLIAQAQNIPQTVRAIHQAHRRACQ